MTPAHHAALRGNCDTLALLLSQGAECLRADNSRRTLIHLAVLSDEISCLVTVIEQLNPVSRCEIYYIAELAAVSLSIIQDLVPSTRYSVPSQYLVLSTHPVPSTQYPTLVTHQLYLTAG